MEPIANERPSRTPQREIKSVRNTIEIIDEIKRRNGVGVTELSNELGLSKGTVHTYLNTLAELNLVKKDDGVYDVGLGFLQYGKYALNNIPFFESMSAKADQLAEETGEMVACFVHENRLAVLVYVAQGANSIKTNHSVGSFERLHCIASGKAILANLSDETVKSIIDDRGLPQKTGNTITDESALFEELEQIRREGVAFNREESALGMKSVAACLNYQEDVLGAIGICGPADRFVDDRFDTELPKLVRGAANEIQLKLQYSDTIV